MGFRFTYLSLALALPKDQDQGPAHGEWKYPGIGETDGKHYY